MDELVYLNFLGDFEVVNENINLLERDPFVHLSNRMFLKLFRLPKELCQFLITELEPYMVPRRRPTDIDVSLRVLIALRFFASGSYQSDVGCNVNLNVSQATVSRSIKQVTAALNHPDVFNRWIKFPINFEEINIIRRRFFEEHNFPGVIGCIDCTHVAIFPPSDHDPDYPEHVYVNRKGYHSRNVQLVCDSDLKIINVNARYPGSSNDTFIWNNSQLQNTLRQLQRAGHTGYYLLGDSGYPLRSWLLTPLEREPIPNSPEHRCNTAHKRTRSLIERCNGLLKMRFRCLLKHRVLHYAPDVACRIINACTVLHNLCIEYRIPEPEDEENGDDLDFGIIHDPNNVNDNIGRINPELAEGRRTRNRLIQNFFN